MIEKILTSIFGSKHDRDIKRMLPVVEEINALEPAIQALSDDELRARTEAFRERLKPFVFDLDAAYEDPEGKSEIGNIRQIDRGYENIDDRLRSLGAHIERVDE